MRSKLFTAFLLTLIVSNQVKAQNNRLHLYASFGAKQLTAQQLSYSKDVSPTLASSIGAGGLFQKRKFLLGTEFYYSNGSKEMDALQIQYSGLNSSLVVGYQIHNKGLKLSLLTGFGYALNHIVTTDLGTNHSNLYNAAMFHNNSYYIPASIMLQRVKTNGTFWGLKTGYNFNISGDNKWQFREKDQVHYYPAKQSGFYLQLILGGLLKL